MPEGTFTLRGSLQVNVAGISLGMLGILAGPDGPAAMLGAYNPELGRPEQHTLRAGDEVTVAGRSVRIVDVVDDGEGLVRLHVRWTDQQAED